MQTYRLLEDLKLDVAHLARYSPRPGTVAQRRMVDDVPEEEKMRRFRMLEALQERISAEINARYLGQKVEVLFEEKVKDRWKGRTPTNKLVFVESEEDLRGRVLPVTITWTGPWSMLGRLEIPERLSVCRSNSRVVGWSDSRVVGWLCDRRVWSPSTAHSLIPSPGIYKHATI